MSTQARPVRIFIAYSTHDLSFKEEIRKRLKPLLRAGKVTVWDNWDIEAGANWDTVIQENLRQADLILLLLSPDALDSDYFYEVEAPIALQRHKAGEAITVGVLLRPCVLKHTPFEFEQYELLPKKGYPITDPHWANADAAYLTVVEEVDALVERAHTQKNASFLAAEAKRLAAEAKNAKEANPFYDLMVLIKGGTFEMGDTIDDPRNTFGKNEGIPFEKPTHSVTIRDFMLCKYPVTLRQWRQIMGKNHRFQGKGKDSQPVMDVTWYEAQEFIKALNQKTNKKYRLPTESEWEYAAREGGRSVRFGNGKDIADPREMNFWACEKYKKPYSIIGNEGLGAPTPVGQFEPNALGLYDMSGNVEEWVEDDWHWNYLGAPTDGSAWMDRKSNAKGYGIIRGGSYGSAPDHCRASWRISRPKTWEPTKYGWAIELIGFRLAHSLPY